MAVLNCSLAALGHVLASLAHGYRSVHVGQVRLAAGPSGRCIRAATTSSAMAATSSCDEAGVPVGGDHADDREDPPGQVGTAGRRVVVGGVVQRLHAWR